MVMKKATRSPDGTGDAQALVQTTQEKLATLFKEGYRWLVSSVNWRCPYNPREPASKCASCQAHPVEFTFRENGQGGFYPPHDNQLYSMLEEFVLEAERILKEAGRPIHRCVESARCHGGCATK